MILGSFIKRASPCKGGNTFAIFECKKVLKDTLNSRNAEKGTLTGFIPCRALLSISLEFN